MKKDLPRPVRSGTGALEAEAAFARLLHDVAFDDIVAMAPALVLQALPVATAALLQVTRPGSTSQVTTSADRCRSSAAPVSPARTQVLALRICLEDRPDAGVLRLSTRSAHGFRGATAVTAAVLTGQLESALDRAHARENVQRPQLGPDGDLDLGVAVGLVMASQQLDREAALELLHGISLHAGLSVADIAAHVIRIGESGSHSKRLRLVDPLPAATDEALR
ncbi:MAG: hypothetical protein WB473_08425 [Pedococcus sp.]